MKQYVLADNQHNWWFYSPWNVIRAHWLLLHCGVMSSSHSAQCSHDIPIITVKVLTTCTSIHTHLWSTHTSTYSHPHIPSTHSHLTYSHPSSHPHLNLLTSPHTLPSTNSHPHIHLLPPIPPPTHTPTYSLPHPHPTMIQARRRAEELEVLRQYQLDMEEQRMAEEREKHATKLDRLKHETEMRWGYRRFTSVN